MKTEIHYKYCLPTEITVQIDSNEKCPVPFPATIKIIHPEQRAKRILVKVRTERLRLPYGDYRLKEYPECCVIERKGGQRELFKNMFNPLDSVRQAKSFRKLAGCEYPYIVIELQPEEIVRQNIHVPDVEALIHKMTLAFAGYGFHVLWIPWRKRKGVGRYALGMLMVHLMLGCALQNVLSDGYVKPMVAPAEISDALDDLPLRIGEIVS